MTLHLTVTKEWFYKILNREKLEDFREIKPHWIQRLGTEGNFKKYDFIIIKNGYRTDSPFMLCECGDIRITRKDEQTDLGKGTFFAIKIHTVVAFKNIDILQVKEQNNER